VVIFLLSSSLLGTGQVQNENHVLKSHVIPGAIHSYNFIVYLFVISIFSGLGLLHFSKSIKSYKFMLWIIFSYFILFFWSIVTFSDQLRYIFLILGVTLCPFGIFYVIEKVNLKYLSSSIIWTLSILIFLSVIYSYLNFPELSRVSGIHNNPNLMGMWLIALLAIILYFSEWAHRITVYVVVGVVAILILFSGSRLAFVVFLMLLTPFVLKNKIFSILTLFFGFLYILQNGIGGDIRALEVGTAVSDSGRSDIWTLALQCIYMEPLVGHGMLGAESCVNKPNLHNSYLRLAVMIGLPLTILFLVTFIAFLCRVIFMKVSPFLKLYLLAIPLMFFAEDYIVGFLSPFFPFLIFILALLLFDLKKSKVYSGGV